MINKQSNWYLGMLIELSERWSRRQFSESEQRQIHKLRAELYSDYEMEEQSINKTRKARCSGTRAASGFSRITLAGELGPDPAYRIVSNSFILAASGKDERILKLGSNFLALTI